MMSPPFLRPHHRQHRRRGVERAGEVGLDDSVEALRTDLAPAPVLDVDAGAIDEDVAAAELLLDALRHRPHLRRVAHVRRLDQRGSAGGADHAGGLLQRLGSPPAQDQPRAGLGESDRPGLADAGARSGNPGDLVGNRTEHVSSKRLFRGAR